MSNLDQSMMEAPREEKKPVFLIVLCVLSLVSIGLNLLTSLFKLIAGPSSEEEMRAAKVLITEQMDQFKSQGLEGFNSYFEKTLRMTESINNANFAYYGTMLIIGLIGLFGVIWMLRRKKLGFHLYIIYSLLASVQIYLFVAANNIPGLITGSSLFFTLLFVGLYALNLKRLH